MAEILVLEIVGYLQRGREPPLERLSETGTRRALAACAFLPDDSLAVTCLRYVLTLGLANWLAGDVMLGQCFTARVFDLTDGRCLYSLPNRPGEYTEAVAMSPDGKIVATKGDQFLTFWDAVTGKELRKFKYATPGSRSITDWMTFTPDGKHLAVTLMGDQVRLVDVETAQVIFQTFAPGAAASACVFSPDHKLMATSGYDVQDGAYFARLWEVDSGRNSGVSRR